MSSHDHGDPSALDMPSLNEQQQYWDKRWEQSHRPNEWQLKRGEKILALLHTLHLEQAKILDVGCGTGWFTDQLAQFGDASGLDLSDRAIAIAKERFPHISYKAANLYELSLPKSYYDVVVAQDVIAHVEDQSGLIDRLSSTLKPDGYLVISMVNKFVNARMRAGSDPREHIKQWLDLRDLRSLLRPEFRILRTTTAIPMGDRGILRLVNSHKLNVMLRWLFPQRQVDTLKEWLGFGGTRIVLAQKRF
jgi:2-polyprenyl-3-methyl-5-hydroxy-6-metoxy-1,4-benzoquinol methylase